MVYPLHFILILCIFCASLSTPPVKAQTSSQNQSFISIDCGVDGDYLDETTGLSYTSDRDFVSTGEDSQISPEFDDRNVFSARLFKNLRNFPQGRKNCYTLKPEQGNGSNYLTTAYFKYGNYDGMNQAPKFDLYLGASYWATIELYDPTRWFYYPTHHFSTSGSISVCLVNTGFGVPFISAMELRPVNSSFYRTDSGFATVEQRLNLGNPNDTYARYKDDVYDRIWKGYMADDWVLVNTTLNPEILTSNDSYKLPSEVLRTAVQARDNGSIRLSFDFPYPLRSFNAYFHFVELETIPDGLKREFTITLNGNQSGPYTLQYLKPMTVLREKVMVTNRVIQFSINPTAQSDFPPILNCYEILIDKITNTSETNPIDVGAMMAIKRRYNLDKAGWQGDPCQPSSFPWEGLNCSSANIPRITTLNLASSGLSGEIASEFSILQELQSLDLSNNQLSGTVPAFLAELPNLATLNLSYNQLKGPLPQSLIEKSNNGTLKLSFENGKTNSSDTCDKKKKNIVIAILISIIFVLVLFILVILAIFWRMKIRGALRSGDASLLISKTRSFTYSEISNITDDFAHIIGEGGFGKVYLGELNDGTQVAIKLLSQSSKQGLKEFHSEVQLLVMLYHRNLLSLIGYCEDQGNMALVYEYMQNGNLRELLSEKNSYVLNWRERVQIAVDSAQGLEYLHNGCKPPIVHRDLKTANILLNENFVAKISDFGLSRVFGTDKDTHISTNPAGTFGYADPEVYKTGNMTKKTDVYSFGIILFELITGQPVVIKASEEQNIHILQWVTPIIESGDIQSIIDKRLEGEFNTNSAWKIVEIAMACVPAAAAERPDMSQVVTELKECLGIGESHAMRRSSSITRSSKTYEMSSIDAEADPHPRIR